MPNLAPKTQVAECSCGNCGKSVSVLLTKNGHAYYFCPWPDGDGNPCSHHERWGKAASQKMQRDYLATRKGGRNAADQPAAANRNHGPAANIDAAPAGTESGGADDDNGGNFLGL